jgi:hypothetical protein
VAKSEKQADYARTSRAGYVADLLRQAESVAAREPVLAEAIRSLARQTASWTDAGKILDGRTEQYGSCRPTDLWAHQTPAGAWVRELPEASDGLMRMAFVCRSSPKDWRRMTAQDRASLILATWPALAQAIKQ